MSPIVTQGPVSLGEEIDFEADVKHDPVVPAAVFELRLVSLGTAGIPFKLFPADVANGKAKPKNGAKWIVDLTQKDGTHPSLPATVECTFFVGGAGTQHNKNIDVQPNGTLSNARWANGDGSELLASFAKKGTKLKLVVDVGGLKLNEKDQLPLTGPIELQFAFFQADDTGKVLTPLTETTTVLSKPVTKPAVLRRKHVCNGDRQIEANWTATTFDATAPIRVVVEVSWIRRPHEGQDVPAGTLQSAKTQPLMVFSDEVAVQLVDDKVKDLAQESTPRRREGDPPQDLPWAQDVVTLRFGVGDPVSVQADQTGRATFPALGVQANATILRAGPHKSKVEWRVSGGTAVVKAGASNTLDLNGRVRLSTWATGFTFRTPGALDALTTPGIDDVSLVQTVWPVANSKVPGGLDVEYAANFIFNDRPPDPHKLRRQLLKDLLSACRKNKIQLLAGYEIVTQDPASVKDAKTKALLTEAGNRGRLFNSFVRNAITLEKAKAGDGFKAMEQHAAAIAAFFAKEDFDIDGVTFDLEVDALGLPAQGMPVKETRQMLGHLYASISLALESAFGKDKLRRDRFVAYATAGFTSDGQNTNSFIAAQPFALARAANVVARPMAYDDGPEDPGDAAQHPEKIPSGSLFKRHEQIIRCALGTGSTDAGLHPGQFQLGVKTSDTGSAVSGSGRITPEGVAFRCEHLCAPYRVGIIPFGAENASDLKKFSEYEKRANPAERPRGTPGQPLQVPVE